MRLDHQAGAFIWSPEAFDKDRDQSLEDITMSAIRDMASLGQPRQTPGEDACFDATV